MKNYYERLGVKETASPEEIKARFREHAQALHPDRHPGDKAKEEKFKHMSEAYEQLHKPESRKKHDKELAQYRAEKRRKEETEAARAAQPHSAANAWTPSHTGVAARAPIVRQSPAAPVQAAASNGNGPGGFWAAVGVAGAVGFVGVLLASAVSNSGTHWDPTVERRRGRDGRFRRS
jgi:curved DNA-binding protein CbpA